MTNITRNEILLAIGRGNLSDDYLERWGDLEQKYRRYLNANRKYEKELKEYEFNRRRYSSLFEVKLCRGFINGSIGGALTFGIFGGLVYLLSKNKEISLICGAAPASMVAFLNLITDFIPIKLPDKPLKLDFLTSEEIGKIDEIERVVSSFLK